MRKLIYFTAFLLIGLVYVSLNSPKHIPKKSTNLLSKPELLREGDILFQSSEYGQGKAIMLATHSNLTHCRILIKENGRWCVLEAIGPVKITPLETWTMYTDDETFKTFRLKNSDSLLTQNKITQIKSIGKSYLGKDYDIYFEWTDEKMYCSELVWKVYKKALNIEVGKLQKLKEFDFSSPDVKAIMKDRQKLYSLMEEPMISPQAIADCELLTEIKLK